jgi:hypothetical protein
MKVSGVISEDDHWVSSEDAANSPSPASLFGAAITAGGVFGGMFCGWVSDRVFDGERFPPLVLFACLQLVCFLALLGPIAGVTTSAVVAFILLFFLSIFGLGTYSLLGNCIPCDIGPEQAAQVTGVMTCVCYIGSGLSGALLGMVLTHWGPYAWLSIMVSLCVIGPLSVFLGKRFLQIRDLKKQKLSSVSPAAFPGDDTSTSGGPSNWNTLKPTLSGVASREPGLPSSSPRDDQHHGGSQPFSPLARRGLRSRQSSRCTDDNLTDAASALTRCYVECGTEDPESTTQTGMHENASLRLLFIETSDKNSSVPSVYEPASFATFEVEAAAPSV